LSAALSVEQRNEYSITHILSVCPEYPSTDNAQDHLNISIEDSEYEDLLIHLPEACRFIEDAVEKGGRVLVHCVMGISRSPAVVAAFYLDCLLSTSIKERPQVHLNYGFAKQLDTFRKCGFDPSPSNPVYRSWKRRNEQDVTAFLSHIEDTVSIIPDKLLLSSEFPSDPEKTWSLLMDLGVTHLLSISPTEISTTAGSLANHHHVNIDSRSPDALLLALPDICTYIDDAIKSGGLVLVHSMIESRACTAVCAYLMSASHHTTAEAFSAISQALPLFNPTRSFIRNLELFEECGCLRNLAAYRAPKQTMAFPRSRSAAVLVALFVGRQGDLYVLLSRRSSTLRTYAGDTSLPGGKVDPEDRSIEDTARREAFEEVGLPRDRTKVPLLCILEPFLAAELIVTPVVVLILDNTLRPILNGDEVASLFSHPLVSFLSSNPPFPHEPDTLEVPYHKSFDFKGSGPAEQVFRVHQFLTGREAGGIKPVFGLTAAMLIRTATIGYARQPDFEVHAPHAPTSEERIAWALLNRKVFREACEQHGIDLRPAKRITEARERRDARRRRKERDGDSKPKSKL
ncbi:hypothetical protein CVT25_003867, partial [Psilocybe cyanescens]